MTNHQDYVAGFMFSVDRRSVMLIKKNRPEWQKGFYNGIGGHIEDGESPVDAMVREFREEAGLYTVDTEWTEFAVITGEDDRHPWRVHFFYAVGQMEAAVQKTDEELGGCYVTDLHKHPIIRNLSYLIPMALCCDSAMGGSRLKLPIEITEVPA